MSEEEEESTIANVLVGLISAGKEIVVTKLVDGLIFPWYEARTGKHSSKVMRRQVAEKVEQALSNTLWITKGHALDLSEDGMDDTFGTPPRFIVGQVFAQSRASGNYALRVSVHERGQPMNAHTLDLEDFMRDFVPYEEVGFEDFDS